MKDRISKFPGRVKLIPVPGEENTFDIIRADEPTEAGTALSKLNLLTDETAALFGLGDTATINQVLAMIAEAKANKNQGVENAGFVWTVDDDGGLRFTAPGGLLSRLIIIDQTQLFDFSRYHIRAGDTLNVICVGGGGAGRPGFYSSNNGGDAGKGGKSGGEGYDKNFPGFGGGGGGGYGAGGGGGGSTAGSGNIGTAGGGGGSGYIAAASVILEDTLVPITIGAGGIAPNSYTIDDTVNGKATSFGHYLTAAGGSFPTAQGAGGVGGHVGGSGSDGATWSWVKAGNGGGGAGGWNIENFTVYSGSGGNGATPPSSSVTTDRGHGGAGGTNGGGGGNSSHPDGYDGNGTGHGAVFVWF